MRSAPGEFWQKTSSPWHYVTVGGIEYDRAPPEGDALAALEFFTRLVRDPATSPDQRALALRFIVHIVGDLHQPLHNGRPGDRGGNEVKVKWFGRDTNLHAVWDSALVDETKYSFSEYSERLQRHTRPEDVIAWWTANPRDWIRESVAYRERIYPAAGETDLGYDYIYQHTPKVEHRLKQAGVRIAAYLNAMFAEPGLPTEVMRRLLRPWLRGAGRLRDDAGAGCRAGRTGARRGADPRHQRLPRQSRTAQVGDRAGRGGRQQAQGSARRRGLHRVDARLAARRPRATASPSPPATSSAPARSPRPTSSTSRRSWR